MLHATPRPWSLVKTDYTYDDTGHYMEGCVIGTDETNIAEMCGAMPPLETIANAALIVRAVNSHDVLVRALERCVEDLEQWKSTYPIAAKHPDEALDDCSTNEIIKRAQLALKLAKGE